MESQGISFNGVWNGYEFRFEMLRFEVTKHRVNKSSSRNWSDIVEKKVKFQRNWYSLVLCSFLYNVNSHNLVDPCMMSWKNSTRNLTKPLIWSEPSWKYTYLKTYLWTGRNLFPAESRDGSRHGHLGLLICELLTSFPLIYYVINFE